MYSHQHYSNTVWLLLMEIHVCIGQKGLWCSSSVLAATNMDTNEYEGQAPSTVYVRLSLNYDVY